MKFRMTSPLLLLAMLASTSHGADAIRLEGIDIMGSAEDAGIMTITSWKDPADQELELEAITGFEEERFEPLEPRSFRSQVDYARRFKTGFGDNQQESSQSGQ